MTCTANNKTARELNAALVQARKIAKNTYVIGLSRRDSCGVFSTPIRVIKFRTNPSGQLQANALSDGVWYVVPADAIIEEM